MQIQTDKMQLAPELPVYVIVGINDITMIFPSSKNY